MAITTNYRTRSDAVPLRSFKAKGRPSAIAGVGVYAPDKIITNFDLEKMMDTSDKWITERTGIRRRHIAEPGTTTFELATKAARSALDAAGLRAKDPAPFIDMVGPDVFKFAVDIFIRQATEVCQAAGVGLDEIDLWVPHQANFRIIDAAARRIGLPIERVAVNIDEFGNTSSASIPLALEEAIRNRRVKSGDHVLLAGFGSGLTWGATLLKWA